MPQLQLHQQVPSQPPPSRLEWQKEKADLEAMIQRQAAMLEKLQIEQSKMIREMQTAHAQLIHQLKIDQINQIDKIQADIDAKVSTSKDLQDQLAQAHKKWRIREIPEKMSY